MQLRGKMVTSLKWEEKYIRMFSLGEKKDTIAEDECQTYKLLT